MLLKMTTSMAGPLFSVSPGDEYDFEDGIAASLIEAGYAVPVAEKKIERAVTAAPAEKRKRDVVSEKIDPEKQEVYDA